MTESNYPIVDVHTHLGISHSTGVRATRETLLGAMEDFGIDAVMVMPQPTDPSALELHDEIAEMIIDHPGRVFGIALLDPRMPEAEFSFHVARLLEDENFVALKLHTFGHNVSPDDEVADKVFRAGRQHRRAVMIHTGLGGAHTLPGRIASVCRAYPDVPIVLCHAGFAAFWAEALTLAEEFDNVMLEPSWSPGFAIGLMVERLGADRVMFGSDHVSNLPIELLKIANLELTINERSAILGGTAARVFRLPNLVQRP